MDIEEKRKNHKQTVKLTKIAIGVAVAGIVVMILIAFFTLRTDDSELLQMDEPYQISANGETYPISTPTPTSESTPMAENADINITFQTGQFNAYADGEIHDCTHFRFYDDGTVIASNQGSIITKDNTYTISGNRIAVYRQDGDLATELTLSVDGNSIFLNALRFIRAGAETMMPAPASPSGLPLVPASPSELSLIEARATGLMIIEIIDEYLEGVINSTETGRRLDELPSLPGFDFSIFAIRIMMWGIDEHTDEEIEQIRAMRDSLAERLNIFGIQD